MALTNFDEETMTQKIVQRLKVTLLVSNEIWGS